MTSSNQKKPKENIGTEVQTSPADAKFSTQRGVEFEVRTLPNGLFYIFMKRGGKSPSICDGLYTSRAMAERDLESYIRKGDKLGYANYPSKEK